jgi:hypothetical protein
MPVAVSPQAPRVHYVRCRTARSSARPCSSSATTTSCATEQGISLALGIYFGLVMLAVMLSVGGAVTVKDPVYTLYTVSRC